MCMKRWFLFLMLMGVVRGQEVPLVEEIPEGVIESAVAAVEDLGKEVVMGRYEVAVERMYPTWKERTAKRLGGMDKLEEQLDNVAKQMLKQGISITDFKPVGEPIAFEVYPGKKVELVDGKEVERLVYTKWMILVPTVTKIRAMLEGDPVAVNIESKGFQVAISEKGSDEWTFIDGSALTVSELRSLFITLPENMVLPVLERKQVK